MGALKNRIRRTLAAIGLGGMIFLLPGCGQTQEQWTTEEAKDIEDFTDALKINDIEEMNKIIKKTQKQLKTERKQFKKEDKKGKDTTETSRKVGTLEQEVSAMNAAKGLIEDSGKVPKSGIIGNVIGAFEKGADVVTDLHDQGNLQEAINESFKYSQENNYYKPIADAFQNLGNEVSQKTGQDFSVNSQSQDIVGNVAEKAGEIAGNARDKFIKSLTDQGQKASDGMYGNEKAAESINEAIKAGKMPGYIEAYVDENGMLVIVPNEGTQTVGQNTDDVSQDDLDR